MAESVAAGETARTHGRGSSRLHSTAHKSAEWMHTYTKVLGKPLVLQPPLQYLAQQLDETRNIPTLRLG